MIEAIFTGIRAHIVGDGSITAALGAAGNVYTLVPAPTAVLPYIVMDANRGGSTNISPRDDFDVTLSIKVISNSATTSAQVADLLRSRLHESQDDVTVPGWNVYRVQHLDNIFFVEHIERKQFYHAGALYRIRAAV